SGHRGGAEKVSTVHHVSPLFIGARGAPPPLASLRRSQTRYPRDSRGRSLVLAGPHPRSRRSGARRLAILATAAGAHWCSRGPPPARVAPALADSLSSRQPRALISARGAPPPLASLRRSQTRYPRDSRGRLREA